MFHRFSTWWRALSVVLLGLATLTWPLAAQAQTTPFSVISQDAVANMSGAGVSRFALTLAVTKGTTNVVQLSLYPQIVYRSEITALMNGTGPSTTALSSTAIATPTCITGSTLNLHVSLFSAQGTGPSPLCGTQPLHLRLPCSATACDGVYPMSIAVTINNVRSVEWSMITVHVASVLHPLLVDFVPMVDSMAWTASALAESNFGVIANYPSFPLTFAVSYLPLSQAMLDSTNRTWRSALSEALASSQHRAIVSPPPNADLAGLAANGFSSEVTQQVSLASSLLRTITGRFTDGPVFLATPPSPATLDALSQVGSSDVVVPDASFTPAPSNTLGWGAPFRVTGATSVTALSTDGGLEQLASDTAIEPGRRAAMTLATLAFLHFEAPNASSLRTVIVPLNVGSISPTYVNDLLQASQSNPFITPSTLASSFNSSLIGTNNSPSELTLNFSTTSAWSSANVSSLTTLISHTNSYLHAIASPTQTAALQLYLATSEESGSSSNRQRAISAATAYLNTQLNGFRIDDSGITLTGASSELPITLFSSVHYPVTVLLHLITNQLSFPNNKKVYVVQLSTSTTPLRIAATDRQGSSLTLQLEVTTPDGQLVLAHAAVQVRGVGTSVVGYLLSGTSLFVLAWWWLRTYRRKSRGRHAR
ncbi:MAG: hypothetical protein HKL85_04150 [Acidimicrobiaceae bacterium]|nr:hypothetical protein [Acidimicrobiaceae bacterium]